MIHELARALSVAVSVDASELERLRAYEHYTRLIGRLSELPTEPGNVSLKSVCNNLHKILGKTFVLDSDLSSVERNFLKAWPSLLMSFIDAPAATQSFDVLMRNVSEASRSNSGGDEEIDSIADYLLSSAADDAKPDAETETGTAIHTVGFIQHLTDKIIVLDEIVSAMPEESDSPYDPEEIYSQCIVQLRDISAFARQSGFLGLAEVCLAVCDVLQAWFENPENPYRNEYAFLTELPNILGDSIKYRNDHAVGNSLVDFVYSPDVMPDLSNDRRAVLREFVLMDFDASDWTYELETRTDENSQQDNTQAILSETFEMSVENLLREIDDTEDAAWEANDVASSDSEFSHEEQQLIDILCTELEEINQAKDTLLDIACDQQAKKEEIADSLERYAASIGHIANAADMIGLKGLRDGAKFITGNILELHRTNRAITQSERELLSLWPDIFHAYLSDIHNPELAHALAGMLENTQWPVGMRSADLQLVTARLQNPSIKASDDHQPRQVRIEESDASLTLPDDVNSELLDGMLQELPNQTEEFSAAIQSMLEDGNVNDIETAQRIAHTLKGAANVVGVRGIANLTHHLEDILEAFSRQHQLPSGALADTLLNAADCLEMMSETLMGSGQAPDNALQVMQDVLDWANYLDREGIPQGENAAPGVDGPTRADSETAHAASTDKLPAETDSPTEPESIEPTLRVPTSQVDELLRLTGENLIATGQVQEHVNQLYASLQDLGVHNKSLQQLAFDLEQLLDVQGVAAKLYSQAAGGEFDALEMDQYNELHTFSRKLVEAASDSFELAANLQQRLAGLEQIAFNQERLHQESRSIILRTRMLPVSTIVPRLRRGVRQACRVTGKQAKLSVKGANVLVDGSVLSELVEPLMHLIRNAVDHGIEAEQVREDLDKPATGTVELEFISSGQQISVSCRDDGCGLDYSAIRKTAVDRGIFKPADDISEEQLNHLLLQSGFSTRSKVTQTSGRGIGLNVVNADVRALKGSLQLRSESGVGTEVLLTLPGSMLSSNSLLIKVDNSTIAVSTQGIEELLSTNAGEIRQQDGESRFYIEGNDYPVCYLDHLLNIPPNMRAGERVYSAMLMLRENEGDGRIAVAVQEITASRSVVVKGLGLYIPRVRGVIGATILGDGSVAPVIDLPDLLQSPVPQVAGIDLSQEVDGESTDDPPYVLVVDDSLSARRSLEQFITDFGMDVRSARDGVEALDVIQERLPDILLVDLEMPRMNGLELAAYIRANETSRHIPVIMITSRSTEKHRAQASSSGVDRYMVKPFSEDELMNNIQTLLEEAE